MHSHGPSCLDGPVSRLRSSWRGAVSGAKAPSSTPPSGREKRNMANNDKTPPGEESPIRWELVNRVRLEIEAGTYDTPEKMEIALDRLLEQLGRE